jgi:hypothetical protein
MDPDVTLANARAASAKFRALEGACRPLGNSAAAFNLSAEGGP